MNIGRDGSGANAEPWQSEQTLLGLLECWVDVAISAWSSAPQSAIGCGHNRVRHSQPRPALSAINSIGELVKNNVATWFSGDGGRGQKLPKTSAGAAAESSGQHKRQVPQNPFTPAQSDFMSVVLQDTFSTLGGHLSNIEVRQQQHAGAIDAMEDDLGAHDVAIQSMKSAIDELGADRDASRASVTELTESGSGKHVCGVSRVLRTFAGSGPGCRRRPEALHHGGPWLGQAKKS